MAQKIEGLIRAVYRQWKSARPKAGSGHPDEETLACFVEGRLSSAEDERLIAHFDACADCCLALSLALQTETGEEEPVPAELIARLKGLAGAGGGPGLLEVVLRVKEKALEILSTTGDVLVGSEFMPAPVLRSRAIKDFKDEVNIFKDFADTRVQLKIEKKPGGEFNLMITAKQKQAQKIIKDLRVSLFQGELELESRLSDAGGVTFEHVLLGRYSLEIASAEKKLAFISLDIKM